MAHFDYIFDVMMTMSLGLASDLMAAKVISKKEGHSLPSAEDGQLAGRIGVNLQRKIKSLRLQFTGAGPCAVHVHQYFSIFFGLQTHL